MIFNFNIFGLNNGSIVVVMLTETRENQMMIFDTMNASALKSALLSLALLGGFSSIEASSSSSTLSEMTASEIISLLPAASSGLNSNETVTEAITVSGRDLLTKAYGTISSVNSSEGAIDMAQKTMNVTPEREDNYLWLDSADGYNIEYNGMSPEVSALVRLENDSISDYGFFFLFPYSADDKENAGMDQTRFSLSMLEDFESLGVDLGANAYTSDLFEVNGDYADNYMAMRLIDDSEGERFILLLSVEPNACNEMDRVAAN